MFYKNISASNREGPLLTKAETWGDTFSRGMEILTAFVVSLSPSYNVQHADSEDKSEVKKVINVLPTHEEVRSALEMVNQVAKDVVVGTGTLALGVTVKGSQALGKLGLPGFAAFLSALLPGGLAKDMTDDVIIGLGNTFASMMLLLKSPGSGTDDAKSYCDGIAAQNVSAGFSALCSQIPGIADSQYEAANLLFNGMFKNITSEYGPNNLGAVIDVAREVSIGTDPLPGIFGDQPLLDGASIAANILSGTQDAVSGLIQIITTITTTMTSTTTSTSTSTTESPGTPSQWTPDAIAGVAVGCLVALGLVVSAVLYKMRSKESVLPVHDMATSPMRPVQRNNPAYASPRDMATSPHILDDETAGAVFGDDFSGTPRGARPVYTNNWFSGPENQDSTTSPRGLPDATVHFEQDLDAPPVFNLLQAALGIRAVVVHTIEDMNQGQLAPSDVALYSTAVNNIGNQAITLITDVHTAAVQRQDIA